MRLLVLLDLAEHPELCVDSLDDSACLGVLVVSFFEPAMVIRVLRVLGVDGYLSKCGHGGCYVRLAYIKLLLSIV